MLYKERKEKEKEKNISNKNLCERKNGKKINVIYKIYNCV